MYRAAGGGTQRDFPRAQARHPIVLNMDFICGVQTPASRTRSQVIREERTLSQQFMLVALIASVPGLPFFAESVVDGTKRVLMGLAILAPVNLLVAITILSRETKAVQRRAAPSASDEEQAVLLARTPGAERCRSPRRRQKAEGSGEALR